MIPKFIQALDRVQAAFDLPLILENLPSLPRMEYQYNADPAVIAEVVERADSGFLLDLAHARAAAAFQGVDIYAYLENLPLSRTAQLHLSGVREKNGNLYDAHEVLEEIDYQLLQWVLARCQPQVVTLEYFREQEPLQEMLGRLGNIVVESY